MLIGWRKKVAKLFLIPQRYVLGLMTFLAVTNAFAMRVCLNVAINEMSAPIDTTNTTHFDEYACPAESSEPSKPIQGGKYNWTSETQGVILSAFFYGYVVTHVPGGILAEKFGGKYTLGLGIFSTAIFTLLTPIAVEIGGSDFLIAIRVLEGLGEGTTYPAVNTLLSQWVPANERGRLGSAIFAGAQIGTIVGTALSGVLIQYTNSWTSVFYLFGGLGVLWFILWVPLCYNSPQSHPFISEEEKEYLDKEIGYISSGKNKPPIPWIPMLTSVPLWALIIAEIGHDWGFFTMVTDLPKYMNDVMKFNIGNNGLYSALPYVSMWAVAISTGALCDWFIKGGYLSIVNARKVFTTLASLGPACFIIGASYAGCDKVLTVTFFTIGMGFMGAFYPGMKVNSLDLSPNYAGTLMALVNGIGAFTGILAPYLVGVLTPNHTLLEWRTAFWICFAVFAVTNLVFVIWASGDTQWWNDMTTVNKESEVEKERLKEGTSRGKSEGTKPSVTNAIEI